jgi:hypothetical protein
MTLLRDCAGIVRKVQPLVVVHHEQRCALVHSSNHVVQDLR